MSVFHQKNPSKAHVFWHFATCASKLRFQPISSLSNLQHLREYRGGGGGMQTGKVGEKWKKASCDFLWNSIEKQATQKNSFHKCPLLTNLISSTVKVECEKFCATMVSLFPNMNNFSHYLKGLNHHRETTQVCNNHPNSNNVPELCPDCLTQSAN